MIAAVGCRFGRKRRSGISKSFVLGLEQAVHIRTGGTGEHAL